MNDTECIIAYFGKGCTRVRILLFIIVNRKFLCEIYTLFSLSKS